MILNQLWVDIWIDWSIWILPWKKGYSWRKKKRKSIWKSVHFDVLAYRCVFSLATEAREAPSALLFIVTGGGGALLNESFLEVVAWRKQAWEEGLDSGFPFLVTVEVFVPAGVALDERFDFNYYAQYWRIRGFKKSYQTLQNEIKPLKSLLMNRMSIFRIFEFILLRDWSSKIFQWKGI